MWAGSKPRAREDLCGFPPCPHGIFREKFWISRKSPIAPQSAPIHRAEKTLRNRSQKIGRLVQHPNGARENLKPDQWPSIHGLALGFCDCSFPSFVSFTRFLRIFVPQPQPLPQEWLLLTRGS